MSPGTTTQGTRQPDGTKPHELSAGDYSLSDSGTFVWLCSPAGEPGHVDDKWTITIEDDATITIAPSIWWDKTADPPGWHGFLQHGIWRQA